MTIYNKIALFSLALLGASVTLAGSLFGNSKALQKPGIALSMYDFNNSDAGRRIRKTMESLKEEKCKWNGGNWNTETNKCSMPETATKPMHAGYPHLKKFTSETDCFNGGGYWWTKNNKCYAINLTAVPKFKKDLKDWTNVEKSDKGMTDEGIKHLRDSNNFEIKKDDENNYVVIFKKELTPMDKDWDFPKHYKYEDSKTISIWNIWTYMKGLIGEGRPEKRIYLYNEAKNTWWNCKWGGNVIFLNTEEKNK